MTLIISAQCNGGICIYADKRYKITEGKQIAFQDDYNKIFSFKDYPLMVSNHGLNRFGEKYWDNYCNEFEESLVWKGKNILEVARAFEAFVSKSVMAGVEKGIEGALSASFLFCGYDTNKGYQIIELTWSHGVDEVKYSIKPFPGITLSGDGQKYILGYVDAHKPYKDLAFWKKINLSGVKKELKKLSSMAILSKNSVSGEEFSDSFDMRCLR